MDGYRAGGAIVALTITGGDGYGQVAATPVGLVTPLPAGLNPVLAVAIPANSATTLVALKEITNLRRGKSVLIHAAASGLESQMGQVVRLLRAGYVVGVVHSETRRQGILDPGYDEIWLTEDLAETNPT